MNEYINPPTLAAPAAEAYTQVTTTTARKTVYVSGQVSWDKEGNVVGEGDLRAQVTQSLENVRLGLQAAGADIGNIVRIRYYVVDYTPESIPALIEPIKAFFGDLPPPASSLIGVSALMYPELLVEIDTIAAIA